MFLEEEEEDDEPELYCLEFSEFPEFLYPPDDSLFLCGVGAGVVTLGVVEELLLFLYPLELLDLSVVVLGATC